MQIKTKRGVVLFVLVIVMLALVIVNVSNWFLLPRDLFWQLLLNANGQLLTVTLITAPYIGIKARQLTIMSEKLEFALNHDQLTRVSTRSHLNKLMQTGEIWPCVVIIADLDHFKAINDTYGHPAGDAVLQRFAEIVKATIRHTDLVARYGGEEFVIVLPRSEADDGAALARRIKERLTAAPIKVDHHNIPLTASFGISVAADLSGLPVALKSADTALYAAKDGGRNQVQVAKAEPPQLCASLS